MSGQSNSPIVCPGCGTVATAPGGYCASCGQKLPTAPPPGQAVAQPMNPYAASAVVSSAQVGSVVQDPMIIKKAEAIIKDAGQVLLAVLIGFLCTGLAAFVIGPFYLYRLFGWNKLAQQCPALLSPGSPPGSLEQRFQAAKGKLIGGVIVGGILLTLVMAVILMAVFTS